MVVFGEKGMHEARRAARARVKINFIGGRDFDGRLPCLSKFFPLGKDIVAQITGEIVKEARSGIVFAQSIPPKPPFPP